MAGWPTVPNGHEGLCYIQTPVQRSHPRGTPDPMLRLTDEELRQTLDRARQIATAGDATALVPAEAEEYVRAAEELGVPREALVQALRERQLLRGAFDPGDLVFAPSMNQFWYVARVAKIDGGVATVDFVGGSEHTCPVAELRPFSLIPGRKIQADLGPWGGGWSSSAVLKYEPETGTVYVDSFGQRAKVELAALRLPEKLVRPVTEEEKRVQALTRASAVRIAVAAGAVGLLAGVLLHPLFAALLPLLR
jgi:hypothetical protein